MVLPIPGLPRQHMAATTGPPCITLSWRGPGLGLGLELEARAILISTYASHTNPGGQVMALDHLWCCSAYMCMLLHHQVFCTCTLRVHIHHHYSIYIYIICDGFTYFSQRIGVITTVPDRVPASLPADGNSINEWFYQDNYLYHNRLSTHFSNLLSLNDFEVGNKVGLLLLPNGELHLFLDGVKSAQLATGLPVHKSLFGEVDVCGCCTKIKSEILSGKLDGVCLCTCTYIQSPHGCTPEYDTDGIKLTLHF